MTAHQIHQTDNDRTSSPYVATAKDLILSTESLAQAVQDLKEMDRIRTEMSRKHTALRTQHRELVTKAVALGMSETEVARLAGVHRHTVRDWLGKRKH